MSDRPIERLGSLESSLFANFGNAEPQNHAAIADLEKELASSLQPKPNAPQQPKPQQVPTFLAYLSSVSRTLPTEKAKLLNEFIVSFSKQKKDAQETVRFLTNLLGKSLTEAAINCGLKEGIFKLPPQAEMKKPAPPTTTAPAPAPAPAPTVATTVTQQPQSMGPTVFTGNLATLRNNPQLQQQVLSKLPPNLTPEQRANVLQQLANGNRLIPIIGQAPVKQTVPPTVTTNMQTANKKPKIEGQPPPTVITTVAAGTQNQPKPVVVTTGQQPSPFANLKSGVNIVGLAKPEPPVDAVKEISDLTKMVGLELPKGEPPKLGEHVALKAEIKDESSVVVANVLKRKVMESVAKSKAKNLTVSEEVYKYMSLGIQEYVKVLIVGLCRECSHKSVNPESHPGTFTITSDVKKQISDFNEKAKDEEARLKKLREDELLKQQQEREKKEAEAAATPKEGATISTTNSAALQAIGDVKVKTKPETPVLTTTLNTQRPTVTVTPQQQQQQQQVQPPYASMNVQQQIHTLKLQLQQNTNLALSNWHILTIRALNEKQGNKTITNEENELFNVLKAWLAKINQQKNKPRTINSKDLMYNPHVSRIAFTKHEIAKRRRDRAQSQRSRMIQGVKAPMMSTLSTGLRQ